MTINDQIIKHLKDFKIPLDDGICYLISLHYNYTPSYIPDSLKKRVNATGIVKSDGKGLQWTLPLFEGGETVFEWVRKEYVPLFKEKNAERGGHIKESIKRMKQFFAENPEIRKNDVIGATKMYMLNTDYRYIRFPHYFIYKDKGVNQTSDLLTWVEKYLAHLERTQSKGTDKADLMQ